MRRLGGQGSWEQGDWSLDGDGVGVGRLGAESPYQKTLPAHYSAASVGAMPSPPELITEFLMIMIIT